MFLEYRWMAQLAELGSVAVKPEVHGPVGDQANLATESRHPREVVEAADRPRGEPLHLRAHQIGDRVVAPQFRERAEGLERERSHTLPVAEDRSDVLRQQLALQDRSLSGGA